MAEKASLPKGDAAGAQDQDLVPDLLLGGGGGILVVVFGAGLGDGLVHGSHGEKCRDDVDAGTRELPKNRRTYLAAHRGSRRNVGRSVDSAPEGGCSSRGPGIGRLVECQCQGHLVQQQPSERRHDVG